ncbi:hypothetical protein OG304_37700 [Streptomyces sp. NBC_00160]|nr:hypothetical protein [Streptomyces sp. NBC_00160]
MAIDGTRFDVADSPANAAEFGRPGTGRGEGTGGYPQVQVVALVECGTHAVVDAVLGGWHDGEVRLAEDLERSLTAGMLVLGDRNLPSTRLWRALTSGGATCASAPRPTAACPSCNRCPTGPGSAGSRPKTTRRPASSR